MKTVITNDTNHVWLDNTMDKYDKSWISRFFVKADKLGNFLSGGNKNHTISARVGRYDRFSTKDSYSPFWELMASIINLAFFPIDGPYHCDQAYEKEIAKDPVDDFRQGSKIMQAVLSVIIVSFFIPISIILWTLKKIKIIKS